MQIYWRTLIGYGFVFWILLCITDFLGVTHVHKYSKGIRFNIDTYFYFYSLLLTNFQLYRMSKNVKNIFMKHPEYFNKLCQELDELYEKPLLVQKLETKLDSHLNQWEYHGVKLGWSLLLWNSLTFLFSILVCTIGRTAGQIFWSLYQLYKTKKLCYQINSPNQYSGKGTVSFSRIPVMVKPASDTNIFNKNKSRIGIEKSCPNLLTRRSGSNLSSATDVTTKTCRSLYTKNIYLCDNQDLSSEEQLNIQCGKLKEELHRLQTISLKEHAILSRKLEAVNNDKIELNKQLMIVQKENRAAKQQLQELLQEKSVLLKKIENATKEFRSNTKTKKYALAKLEEVTNNVEELRQQLEQVSRDKEILEKKLKLLEIEYNKLHERYIASQQKFYENNCNNNEHLPERDENIENDKRKCNETRNIAEMEKNSTAIQQTAEVLASVSQTEMDMKKIQEKIKQLEKNLENLNMTEDYEYNKNYDTLESEISLSGVENNTDSLHRIDDEESGTNFSEFSNNHSPRQRYWSKKVADIIGRKKNQFAKIQALASTMQEKAHFLGNIRERFASNDELESTDSEREPKRLVSSSMAFKNFLKSIKKLDATKKEISSNHEVYF